MYRVPVKTLCSITHRVMVRLLSGLTCTSETTGTCEHAPKHKATPHTIKIRFIIHLPKSLDERRLEVENYFRNSAIYSAKKHYSIAFQPKPDRQFSLIFLKGFSNPGAGITCLIFTLSDFQRNVKGKVNKRQMSSSGLTHTLTFPPLCYLRAFFIVIFGLDPEIQGKRSQYIIRILMPNGFPLPRE